MDPLTTSVSTPTDFEFFAGSGEMAKLMRQHDWSRTPLGDPSTWPQSLRTTVRILLTSRFAMWMAWGPDLTCFYNDAYRHDTLGLKHPWALGATARKVWEEIWPDIGPMIDSVLATGIATWESAMLLYLERSGYREETYHTFSYQPISDDTGQVSGMLCVVTEDTQRVIAERRIGLLGGLASRLSGAYTEQSVLEIYEECLQSTAQDAPFTLVYLVTEDGTTAYLAAQTNLPPGSALAPPAIHLTESDSIWRLHRVVADPTLYEIAQLVGDVPLGPWDHPATQAVVVPITQQGQERLAGFLVAGVNPYRPLDASYRGFYGLVAGQLASAISNARAYEAERRRAEELAKLDNAKTAFFSNVSHELRTPLTLILGPLEEALAECPTEDSSLRLAYRNALRLLRLVNTLLDFSRIEAGRITARFEPVDLPAFTADLASNFRSAAEKAGIDLVIDTQPLEHPLYVDPQMWEKIVLNLVSNAVKHTFQGSIHVRLGEADGGASLSVTDTGSGIPEDELPRIFDRFHRVESVERRTYEGTGIGLALVQELVHVHKGTISVTSELGRGSRFEVWLPFGSAHLPADSVTDQSKGTDPTRTDSAAFVDEAMGWLPNETSDQQTDGPVMDPTERAVPSSSVLIVEDNPDMRSYLARLLSPSYLVATAVDGLEALEAIRRSKPNLVLTDAMMPGMDGFGLIRCIREDPELAELPVIMLSARAGEEATLEGLDKGADDYIVKPFAAQALLAKVQSCLRLTQLRREAALKEKALWEAAETSRMRLDLVLQRMQDIFVLIDADWRYSFVSESAARAAGSSREEMIGQVCWRSFSQLTGTPLEVGLRRAMAQRTSTRVDVWSEAMGSHYELRADPSPDGGLAILAVDVTERIQSEQMLEKRVAERTAELIEANREMEGFTYTVSHDLRTPLRAIVYNSSLLLQDLGAELSSEHRNLLERQMNAAKKVATLVDDLLRLSRLAKQELKSEPVDLSKISNSVAGALKDAGNQDMEFQIEEGMTTRGDPELLHLVMVNLMENACKFSPKGGTVTVGKKADSDGVYFVMDQGIGFEPKYAAKVFEPFERLVRDTDFPGTGIGLANVKRIIERHRGRVWVETEPGQGATFFFQLA